MKRRIFVALPIIPAMQEQAQQIRVKYADLPVRWLNGRNLHVTLVPPWLIHSPREIDEVIKKLQTLRGRFEPLDLSFNTVTFGPTPYNPRLVWAEGSSTPALSRLKEELEFVLRKEGDLRPYKPHLTLARFDPDRFDRFPIKKLRWPIDWVEKAGSLVLMESAMQRHGADYRALAEIKL